MILCHNYYARGERRRLPLRNRPEVGRPSHCQAPRHPLQGDQRKVQLPRQVPEATSALLQEELLNDGQLHVITP